jgi:hypothetical protein
MGKTTTFYLPSLTIQNRGAGGTWPAGGGAAPAGGPMHDDDREVGQNEEEFEATDSTSYLGLGCSGGVD